MRAEKAKEATETDAKSTFVSMAYSRTLKGYSRETFPIKTVSTDGSYDPGTSSAGWAVFDHETKRAYNGSTGSRSSNEAESMAILKAIQRFGSNSHTLHIQTDSMATILLLQKIAGNGRSEHLAALEHKFQATHGIKPDYSNHGHLFDLVEALDIYPLVVEHLKRCSTPQLLIADKMARRGRLVHQAVVGNRGIYGILPKNLKKYRELVSPSRNNQGSSTIGELNKRENHDFFLKAMADMTQTLYISSTSIKSIGDRLDVLNGEISRKGGPDKRDSTRISSMTRQLKIIQAREKTTLQALSLIRENFLNFLSKVEDPMEITNLGKDPLSDSVWNYWAQPFLLQDRDKFPEWYLDFLDSNGVAL